MDIIVEILLPIKKWTNVNSGFLTLVLFVTTLILGWATGLFTALLRKPKLKIEILEGPSFCSTLQTGRKHNGHNTHLTAIALYLSISNIGTAPTQISRVQIAYHNYSIIHTLLWFWLKEQTAILNDFQVSMGKGNLKVYPFLTQKSFLDGNSTDTYLREGQNAIGVVYFEQPESWGSFLPRQKNEQTFVKISILDTYGRKYCKTTKIPFVSISEARKYNPAIGMTRETLREGRESQQQK